MPTSGSKLDLVRFAMLWDQRPRDFGFWDDTAWTMQGAPMPIKGASVFSTTTVEKRSEKPCGPSPEGGGFLTSFSMR